MKDGNPHWGKTFECAVLKMSYLPVPAPGCMSLLGRDGRRKSHPKSVSLFFDPHPLAVAFSYVQTAQFPCSHNYLPHVCKSTF